MRFDPNGLVTICCKSLQPLGHIGRDRLLDLWNGEVRRRVVAALAVDDFSVGCQRCGAEIEAEGRSVSYAAIHDQWAGHLNGSHDVDIWPVRMEMNLSNACNLQCIQCDGESSSAIRIHRERRPPLSRVYGAEFFEDLASFLPHLQRISFGGGEPFLGPENFRVWEMVAEMAPHIDCVVVTNATVWTPRIEELLSRVRFSFVFSIDGITKETYESIRVGANFEQVMANVERFVEYTRQVGSTASVNHCLMPQNHHEFGKLLLWAEDRGLCVNVSVVRSPAHASIAELDPAAIRSISDAMAREEARVRPLLRLNRETWDGERARLDAWARRGSAYSGAGQSVMWFRCDGHGPVDDRSAKAELGAWVEGGTLAWVDVGTDDLIHGCEQPWIPPEQLVGRHFHELTKVVTGVYGEMVDYRVDHTDDDRLDAMAMFGVVPARITTIAMRSDSGRAEIARILVALRTSSPSDQLHHRGQPRSEPDPKA